MTAATRSFWRSHWVSTTHLIYQNIWFFHRPLANRWQCLRRAAHIFTSSPNLNVAHAGVVKPQIWVQCCNLHPGLHVLLMSKCKFGRPHHRTPPLWSSGCCESVCSTDAIHPICLFHVCVSHLRRVRAALTWGSPWFHGHWSRTWCPEHSLPSPHTQGGHPYYCTCLQVHSTSAVTFGSGHTWTNTPWSY